MHDPVFQVLNEVSKHHDDGFYGYAGADLAELITNAVQSRDHALLELIQTTLTSDCEQFCTTEQSIHWHRNPDEFTKNIRDSLSLQLIKTAFKEPAATPLIIPFITNAPRMMLHAVSILASDEPNEVHASLKSFVQSIHEKPNSLHSTELLVGLAAGGPSVDDVFSIDHPGDEIVDIALALGCVRDYGLATSLFKRPVVSRLLSGLRCTRKKLLAGSKLAEVVAANTNESALIIDSMLNHSNRDAIAKESMFAADEWFPDHSGNENQSYRDAYHSLSRISTRLVRIDRTLSVRFPLHTRGDESPQTTLANWVSVTQAMQAAGNEFDIWCSHIATTLRTLTSEQLLSLFEVITSPCMLGDTLSLFRLSNETHHFSGVMKFYYEALSHPNCPDSLRNLLTPTFSNCFSATHALTLLSSGQTLTPEQWSLIGKSLTQSKVIDEKGALIDHLYAMALLIPKLELLCPQQEVATWLQGTRIHNEFLIQNMLQNKGRQITLEKVLGQFDRIYFDEKNNLRIQTYQQLTSSISSEQSAIHDLFSSQQPRF